MYVVAEAASVTPCLLINILLPTCKVMTTIFQPLGQFSQTLVHPNTIQASKYASHIFFSQICAVSNQSAAACNGLIECLPWNFFVFFFIFIAIKVTLTRTTSLTAVSLMMMLMWSVDQRMGECASGIWLR